MLDAVGCCERDLSDSVAVLAGLHDHAAEERCPGGGVETDDWTRLLAQLNLEVGGWVCGYNSTPDWLAFVTPHLRR